MAACRTCEAPVLWAETAAGKKMPLDAVPVPTGTMAYVHGKCWPVTAEDRKLHRELYTSHFVTCPHAGDWRRRK